ncbi:MAG: HlyD family efflux transporter periplasmic adaptor subunit [Pseudomonadota bacterium]
MAVKVRRERPDQRRHHRVTAPLFVDVGGWRLRAADWSLGGIRLVGYPDALPALHEEIDLHLVLPFQGFEVAFDAKAEVVRHEPDAQGFALKFTEIGERERELMSHFIEELIRGSMVDVEDTINRIDVPVTPASLEPDASPADQVPVRRWPIKTFAMTGLYVLLGFVVFAYTAMLIYANFYRLEVQTAVITSPVDRVTARVDGRLIWKDVAVGKPVKKGEVILDVADTQIDREIEVAQIDVGETKAKLAYVERRYLEELQRVRSFATVEVKNVEQAKLRLEALEAQLATAELHRNRIQSLFGRGYATGVQREDAEKRVITLKKSMQQTRVELESRVTLANENIGRRIYTGENVVGDLGKFEAEVELAKRNIDLARQKLAALARHRERFRITAPFDGQVIKLPLADNLQVRRGDTVAIIEPPKQRLIKAFLTQDEILYVGMGAVVDIVIPSLTQRIEGTVVGIDRTSGFVREQEFRKPPGYSWRGPSDRSAEVTIEIKDVKGFQTDVRYRPGTPVIVVFPRNSVNAALRSVQDRLLGAE